MCEGEGGTASFFLGTIKLGPPRACSVLLFGSAFPLGGLGDGHENRDDSSLTFPERRRCGTLKGNQARTAQGVFVAASWPQCRARRLSMATVNEAARRQRKKTLTYKGRSRRIDKSSKGTPVCKIDNLTSVFKLWFLMLPSSDSGLLQTNPSGTQVTMSLSETRATQYSKGRGRNYRDIMAHA